jgi:hypothetical protein
MATLDRAIQRELLEELAEAARLQFRSDRIRGRRYAIDGTLVSALVRIAELGFCVGIHI